MRQAKSQIVDLFEVYGFKVRGDWIEVDDHHELVFDDTKVRAGGVRVFRRNSCGRFLGKRFRGAENPDQDREVYANVHEMVALHEKKCSPADFEHPLLSNLVFMDLDCFLENSPIWIDEMMVTCPDCNGTGATLLNVATCDCATCEGEGEIERESLP